MIDLKKRADQNTGAGSVRKGYEFDQGALEAWMAETIEDADGKISDVLQFKGGQSNPTYKIVTQNRDYVLRTKPRGALLKTAHAIDREFRVMKALGPTDMPVPKVHTYCDDEKIIGVAFYLMDFTSGVTVWDLPTDRWSRGDREAIWRSGADAAMKLHCVDYKSVGLADFGKEGGYVARQLKRWSEQYDYTKDGVDNPALKKLIDWLPQYLPANEPTTIVHGDLQLSNMILADDFSQCSGVIDWELSTLGNPISDFAYFCRDYYLPVEAGGFGNDAEALGIPDKDEIIDLYCQKTGQSVGDNWLFYVIFNMFRLAAIRQGVAKRIKDGTATSANADVAAKGAVLMAENAWQIVQEKF